MRVITGVHFPQVKNKPWIPWVYTWSWHRREQKGYSEQFPFSGFRNSPESGMRGLRGFWTLRFMVQSKLCAEVSKNSYLSVLSISLWPVILWTAWLVVRIRTNTAPQFIIQKCCFCCFRDTGQSDISCFIRTHAKISLNPKSRLKRIAVWNNIKLPTLMT